MNFIWFILIGIAAGFLAGRIMKGKGFGLIVNLLVGIVGGVIGGWVFGFLNITCCNGIVGNLISATIGAILLLFVLSLFKKK
jgi:uncharacterized membrane protein YeaQ/YmgE (transglycosylase-associated protein family)